MVLGFGVTAITVASVTPLLMANVAGVIKIVTGGLLLTVVLISWVYLSTYYVLEGNELRIRSGPFRWRIAIEEIHGVSATRLPWSSPALSLNRLRIDYGEDKWILLSPERREEFLQRLGVPLT